MTLAEFSDLVSRQGGYCAICQKRSATCVDHDHATGRIRGILCSGCNAAIGMFGENPITFHRALTYLGKETENAISQ